MKQHITPEQLDELSLDQKSKLNSWMRKHNYSNYAVVAPITFRMKTAIGWVITTPSIGQMIEFLQYNGKLGQILYLLTWTGATAAWRVTNEKGVPSQIDGRPDFKELCDTLWESVKKELEK